MSVGGWGDLNGYDRLTVEKLQTYIRPGCLCVVCSEARAQLAQRAKESQS